MQQTDGKERQPDETVQKQEARRAGTSEREHAEKAEEKE